MWLWPWQVQGLLAFGVAAGGWAAKYPACLARPGTAHRRVLTASRSLGGSLTLDVRTGFGGVVGFHSPIP